jgi:ubiquinone/menaquinone biosynthesis C-methylase UbiE
MASPGRRGSMRPRVGATGGVLELAGGTGWWTARLASTAAQLTVIDASPEVLAINRQRVATDVTYVVADVFEWRPDRAYDVVFFSFWLSHVRGRVSLDSGHWCVHASLRAVECSSSTAERI